MLFVRYNPAYPAHAPLVTLVVPHGEVGVVSRLWGQAVVEVLAVTRVVLVHRTHCLDHLRETRDRLSWSQRKELWGPHPEIQ